MQNGIDHPMVARCTADDCNHEGILSAYTACVRYSALLVGNSDLGRNCYPPYEELNQRQPRDLGIFCANSAILVEARTTVHLEHTMLSGKKCEMCQC